MKKIFAIALVIVLALSLLTACGGNSNTPSGGDNTNPPSNSSTPGGNNSTPGGNDNNPGKLTMSITVPNGWKEVDFGTDSVGGGKKYSPAAYPSTDFKMYIEKNSFDMAARAYVENKLKNHETMFGDDYDYVPIGDITLGGHDALEFTTIPKDDKGYMTIWTYIHKGEYVYVVQRTALLADYEFVSADMDAMFFSYTLK